MKKMRLRWVLYMVEKARLIAEIRGVMLQSSIRRFIIPTAWPGALTESRRSSTSPEPVGMNSSSTVLVLIIRRWDMPSEKLLRYVSRKRAGIMAMVEKKARLDEAVSPSFS